MERMVETEKAIIVEVATDAMIRFPNNSWRMWKEDYNPEEQRILARERERRR